MGARRGVAGARRGLAGARRDFVVERRKEAWTCFVLIWCVAACRV